MYRHQRLNLDHFTNTSYLQNNLKVHFRTLRNHQGGGTQSVWMTLKQSILGTAATVGLWAPPAGSQQCVQQQRLHRRFHREVSRLCRGLPGHRGRVEEFWAMRLDLGLSLCSGTTRSSALLFWLREVGNGTRLGSVVSGGGAMTELRLVGGSSSLSFSSIKGIRGSESPMRNSGWLMKLWMELRDSGVSRPS